MLNFQYKFLTEKKEDLNNMDLYEDPYYWESNAIKAALRIMKFLKKSKLMESIGHIFQNYIETLDGLNILYNSIDDYIINMNENGIFIDKNEKIMIYVLEININKTKYKKNKNKITKSMVYNAFGNIIYEMINGMFITSMKSATLHSTTYKESYLLNFISQVLVNKSNELTISILKSTYYIAGLLAFLNKNNILQCMDTTMTQSQDLDIHILTNDQIRNVKEIFNTKKTIYVRILLILSNHMIRENSNIDPIWLKSKTSIKNNKDLIEMFDNIVIETLISLTGEIVLDEANDSFENKYTIDGT